jgi:hypothetical protein
MIILTACNLLPSAIPSFVARRYSIHGSVFFGLIFVYFVGMHIRSFGQDGCGTF